MYSRAFYATTAPLNSLQQSSLAAILPPIHAVQICVYVIAHSHTTLIGGARCSTATRAGHTHETKPALANCIKCNNNPVTRASSKGKLTRQNRLY